MWLVRIRIDSWERGSGPCFYVTSDVVESDGGDWESMTGNTGVFI